MSSSSWLPHFLLSLNRHAPPLNLPWTTESSMISMSSSMQQRWCSGTYEVLGYKRPCSFCLGFSLEHFSKDVPSWNPATMLQKVQASCRHPHLNSQPVASIHRQLQVGATLSEQPNQVSRCLTPSIYWTARQETSNKNCSAVKSTEP